MLLRRPLPTWPGIPWPALLGTAVLIVVLGGSLAVVGYPAAGAPRRQFDGGTRTHPARAATAISGSSTADPPGTPTGRAPTRSGRPGQSSDDPPPASHDPRPSAAPSGQPSGQPTASEAPPSSAPPSTHHPSAGHASGRAGTPRAATAQPGGASPAPDEAPRLRQRPQVPEVQSIEPEAVQSAAGDLPVPTPAAQPSSPSAAVALPVGNPTGGGPAPVDQPLTLIWSGLFALALAVTGMTMVVRRRRQW